MYIGNKSLDGVQPTLCNCWLHSMEEVVHHAKPPPWSPYFDTFDNL